MWTPESEQISRSSGWYGAQEQEAILGASVAISGVGGAGFPLGLSLVRDGVQRLAVADPDTIGVSNFNRHPGAFISTLGRNKAEVFREMALQINPDADIRVYSEGTNQDNVDEFVAGADLVFDGIDFNVPAESVQLHRAARNSGIAVLTGLEIGPSAVITSFKNGGVTFEERMGFDPDDSIESIAEKTKNGLDLSSSVPYLPYKSSDISVMRAVQQGAPLPSHVHGVNLFAAATGFEVFKHLTSGIENSAMPAWVKTTRKLMGSSGQGPIWAPHYKVIDLETGKSKIVRQSKARFYYYAALLSARSGLGLNPAVNYDHAIPPNDISNQANT